MFGYWNAVGGVFGGVGETGPQVHPALPTQPGTLTLSQSYTEHGHLSPFFSYMDHLGIEMVNPKS
jgi:hypothetical protein